MLPDSNVTSYSLHLTGIRVLLYTHPKREDEPPATESPGGFFYPGGALMGKKYKESDPFYHSGPWKAARKERLRIDNGMCCDCMERFYAYGEKPRHATMVHHVISRKERPDLELEISNLRSLCDICHNRRHPEKGGHGDAADRTTRQPPRMRVIKL